MPLPLPLPWRVWPAPFIIMLSFSTRIESVMLSFSEYVVPVRLIGALGGSMVPSDLMVMVPLALTSWILDGIISMPKRTNSGNIVRYFQFMLYR